MISNQYDGCAFDDLNPILQAEYITWTKIQYERMKSMFKEDFDFKSFLESCMSRDSSENLYRSIVISAYTIGWSNTLNSCDGTRDYTNDMQKALQHVCRVYGFKELEKKLERHVHDGKHPLSYMVLPHSGNIIANFPPLFVSSCNAHYRKAGNRVYKFLTSLGAPDDSLRKEFLQSILDIKEVDDKQFMASNYEQHLMLDVSDGESTSTVFIDFFAGPCNCIVLVRQEGMAQRAGAYIVSTRREITGTPYTQADYMVQNMDGDEYKWAFDLLVNAWVAEKTGMAVVGDEPRQERARVRNTVKDAIGKETAVDVAYDYIRVTDKAWSLHKESQKALSEHSSDSTWVKAMWWRRQHFAIRGEHKVFIKGHWCHRKCGPVVDEPEVVEILV